LAITGIQPSTSSVDRNLVVDANGVLKTSISSSSNVTGYLTSNIPLRNTVVTRVIAHNVLIDSNTEYNNTTGIFIPKESGVYEYEIGLNVTTVNDNRLVVGFQTVSNNSWIARNNFPTYTTPTYLYSKGVVVLTAGISYAFAAATNSSGTIESISTGSTGSGIGTFLSIKRLN
jgi:hypothetical protein